MITRTLLTAVAVAGIIYNPTAPAWLSGVATPTTSATATPTSTGPTLAIPTATVEAVTPTPTYTDSVTPGDASTAEDSNGDAAPTAPTTDSLSAAVPDRPAVKTGAAKDWRPAAPCRSGEPWRGTVTNSTKAPALYHLAATARVEGQADALTGLPGSALTVALTRTDLKLAAGVSAKVTTAPVPAGVTTGACMVLLTRE